MTRETKEATIVISDGRLPDWYWVDNSVNTNYAPLVKASGIAVYTALVLLSHGNPEFHASSTTIAALAGLDSREAVISALQRLEDNRLIAVFRKDGRASSYRILNVGVPDPTIPRAFRPSDRPQPVGKTSRLAPDLSEKPAGQPVGKTDRLAPDLSEKPAGLSTTCRKNQQDLSEKPTLHRIDTHHHSNTSTIHNDDDAHPGTRRTQFATWDELRKFYGDAEVLEAQRVASNRTRKDDLHYIAGVCRRRALQGPPRLSLPPPLPPELATAIFTQANPEPAHSPRDPLWAKALQWLDAGSDGDSLMQRSTAELRGDTLVVSLNEPDSDRSAWVQNRMGRRISFAWEQATGTLPTAIIVQKGATT